MRQISFMWLVMVGVLVSGCGPGFGNPTWSPPTSKYPSYITEDPYENRLSIKGDRISTRDRNWKLITYCLIASKSQGNPDPVFALLLWHSRGGNNPWPLLNQAYDRDGHKFATFVGDRHVDRISGFLKESLIIHVTYDYLIQHQMTGMDLKIDGRRNDLYFEIPSRYIINFIQRFHAYKHLYAQTDE